MGGVAAVVAIVAVVGGALLAAAAAAGGNGDGGDFGEPFGGGAGALPGDAPGDAPGETPDVPPTSETPDVPPADDSPTLPSFPGILGPLVGIELGAQGPIASIGEVSPTITVSNTATPGAYFQVGAGVATPADLARRIIGPGSEGAQRKRVYDAIAAHPENGPFNVRDDGAPRKTPFGGAFYPRWQHPTGIEQSADRFKAGGSYGVVFIPNDIASVF